jgi:hypothetical protein
MHDECMMEDVPIMHDEKAKEKKSEEKPKEAPEKPAEEKEELFGC